MDNPSSIFLPAKPRVHRKRKLAASSPEVAAPVLVSASVNTDDGLIATLVFDRPVSVAGFNSTVWNVMHHPLEGTYLPVGVSLIDPVTVEIPMVLDSSCEPGPEVYLNAATGNGIVAVDGGIAWDGASALELPFP